MFRLRKFPRHVRSERHPRATIALAPLLAFAVMLGGCRDAGPVGRSEQPPPPGEPLPPLAPGSWFLHTAEGRAVPGVVLAPPPGVGLERTQVDSVRIHVESSGAVGYQSWHVRTEADGSIMNVATLGSGSWTSSQDGYLLRIGSSGHEMVLAPTADGGLAGDHRLATSLGGLTYAVLFRTTRP